MKAAIFDLDGTLLDSTLLWNNLARLYLEKRKIPHPSDIAEKLKSMSLRNACSYLRAAFRIDEPVDKIMADCNSIISDYYLYTLPVKPGAVEFLQSLTRKGVRLCVATASDKNHALSALGRIGIKDFFEFIITDEDVGEGKDNPAIYFAAAERLGLNPAECVVFEDALHAVRTAKKAGFTVWAVSDTSAMAEENEIKSYCDRFIYSYQEINWEVI